MEGAKNTIHKVEEKVQKSLHTAGERFHEGTEQMKRNSIHMFEVDSDQLPDPDPEYTQSTL